MTTALLVIDVQQGLCTGVDAAHDAAGVVARIDRMARRARAARVPVFFVQHESTSGFLAYGSAAWRLADGLHAIDGDQLVRKTTPDAFHRTALASLLEERGVDTVVVCGMHSEFCVDTTSRKALLLGHSVILVRDGHTTSDKPHLPAERIIEHHNETLTNIASFGPRVRLETADALFA